MVFKQAVVLEQAAVLQQAAVLGQAAVLEQAAVLGPASELEVLQLLLLEKFPVRLRVSQQQKGLK